MLARSKIRQQRKGVVLLIVLGLLGLFMAVGISFAVLSGLEKQASANFKRSANAINSTVADISDREALMQFAIVQLIYDTNNRQSAIRGHSLLRDMFGGVKFESANGTSQQGADPLPALDYTVGGSAPTLNAYDADNDNVEMNKYYWQQGTFNGSGLFLPRDFAATRNGFITYDPVDVNGDTTDDGTERDLFYRYLMVPNEYLGGVSGGYTPATGHASDAMPYFLPFNFIEFQPGLTNRTADPDDTREPERYVVGGANHFFGYDEDYDAADHNNMFLALERADGHVIQPSFHRPFLVKEIENGDASVAAAQRVFTTLTHDDADGRRTNAWRSPVGRRVILRPRELEYNASVATGNASAGDRWRDMFDLDGTGIAGDSPEELDVDSDGDGIKDAIWLDLGYPPQPYGTGQYFKPLFAFKVIDLDGKINLNTAGRMIDYPISGNMNYGTRTEIHQSHLGVSPTEVNPKHALLIRSKERRDDNNTMSNDDPTANDLAPDWKDPVEYVRLMRGYYDITVMPSTVRARGKWNPKLDLVDDTSLVSNFNVYRRAGIDGDVDNTNTLDLLAARIQDTRHTPFDWAGSGSVWEPFTGPGAKMYLGSASNRYRNIQPAYISHLYYGFNNWQTAGVNIPPDQNLDPNSPADWLSTLPTARGLDETLNELKQDRPEELQLYSDDNFDSPFTASQFEALYRQGDVDSSSLDPRLLHLLPEMFAPESEPVGGNNTAYALWMQREYARKRMRRMFTHASWDLNRFSLPPTLPSSDPGNTRLKEDLYQHSQTQNRHNGALGWRSASETIGDQGDVTSAGMKPSYWAAGGQLKYDEGLPAAQQGTFGKRFPEEIRLGQRYDLSKQLASYGSAPDKADQQRTAMAEQIYVLLWLAVNPDPGDADLVRTLAQIAVNIVDYMDEDEAMTYLAYDENLNDGSPDWDPRSDGMGRPQNIVLGFEKPDAVINEALAVAFRTEKDPDPAVTGDEELIDRIMVWAELRNPWPKVNDKNGTSQDVRQTVLSRGSSDKCYRIRIVERDSAGADLGRNTKQPIYFDQAAQKTIAGDDGAEAGLYVVGPKDYTIEPGDADATFDPVIVPDVISYWDGNGTSNQHGSQDAWYDRDQSTMTDANSLILTVELQRLRDPYHPFDSTHNPYVTLDYVRINADETAAQDRGGAYYIDQSDPMRAAPLGGAGRLSLERQQPWVGQQERKWEPTGAAEETIAKYLGSPFLSNTSPFVTELTTKGFIKLNRTNVHTLVNTSGQAGMRNEKDGMGYLTFPFLNRPLASPLELLSLRLYGAHFWTKDDENQWRLRFTDDYEFVPGTYSGSMPVTTRAGTYRSRVVPWFDDTRSGSHPADSIPNLAGKLKPIHDLYRFFELVECHSRMRDAHRFLDPTEAQNSPLADGKGGTLRNYRVPGKINLNTITDEEVFRALFDSAEVMPATLSSTTYVTDTTRLNAAFPNFAFNPRRHLPAGMLLGVANGDTVDRVGDFSANFNFFPNWVIPERQWPGIQNLNMTYLPGRYRHEQVHSEMYRQFLLSRAGSDGVMGTADDKPFRSFWSDRLSDTILRRRNFTLLDSPSEWPGESTTPAADKVGEYLADSGASPTVPNGQWTPRLFDPAPLPYSPPVASQMATDGDQSWKLFPIEIDRKANTYPLYTTATDTDKLPVDFWMLEQRRNKLLGKIANNVTTRSHVFAVWLTVGYFRVEPGTENYKVPLLNEEVGIDEGKNIRHRCFFFVDRSLAQGYKGPQSPALKDIDVLTLPEKIRIIE